MKNQRRILGILWYKFVTNVEVATLSQLPSINEAISQRRHSLFGHIRRMDEAAPAHQALNRSATSRQGLGQFGTWKRQPGRPRKCWGSRSPRAQGSLLLMLGVLRRIGQHGERAPSTVKRWDRERERERGGEVQWLHFVRNKAGPIYIISQKYSTWQRVVEKRKTTLRRRR